VNRAQALVKLISRLQRTALARGEIESLAREIAEIAGFDAEERRACGLGESGTSQAFREAMPQRPRRHSYTRG
jgi:hypothetical protein